MGFAAYSNALLKKKKNLHQLHEKGKQCLDVNSGFWHLALRGGMPSFGMGSVLSQVAFWEAWSHPTYSLASSHSPYASTTCLGITVYETDFLLWQVLRVGAEELEIVWGMYDSFGRGRANVLFRQT